MNQFVRPTVVLPPELPEANLPFCRPFYRLTVQQYHRMGETGILPSGTRVELLEGLLVAKMTIHPPHAATVARLSRLLSRMLPETWAIRVQSPITLRHSEPEPDVVVANGPDDVFLTRHPGPRDVLMVVEVADGSLLEDRRRKAPLYARARIPQFWIVNLVDKVVEVYTSPRAGKYPVYLARQDYVAGETTPLILGDAAFGTIAVDNILL
jgi:hypothetical protein